MSKVTVVGAGFYGSTTAQRIAEADYVDEVVLIDIVEGRPQGLALDMMQSRSIEGFKTVITGSNDYAATAGSDVVVITAGLPRKPGMSRMDLLEVNAKIVSSVTKSVVEHSPDCVIAVVSNPLDEMTSLAHLASGLPTNKVIGQAGMLDTARFKHFVGEECNVQPTEVEAMTLGSHGDTMVPVPSLVKVAGKAITDVLSDEKIEEIVQKTRAGGAEIVGLLKTGSAYYAPSSAVAKMVEAVIKDSGEVMPVCAYVDGQYGVSNVFLGVPVKLGKNGVEEVVELDLAAEELVALKEAGEAVSAKQADVKQFA
jgi:malate dehydrogenase